MQLHCGGTRHLIPGHCFFASKLEARPCQPAHLRDIVPHPPSAGGTLSLFDLFFLHSRAFLVALRSIFLTTYPACPWHCPGFVFLYTTLRSASAFLGLRCEPLLGRTPYTKRAMQRRVVLRAKLASLPNATYEEVLMSTTDTDTNTESTDEGGGSTSTESNQRSSTPFVEQEWRGSVSLHGTQNNTL